MKGYLLDINICIYFLKGQFGLIEKVESAGLRNCFISEISIAELKYGVEKSNRVEDNRAILLDFQNRFTILPIFNALDIYAKEKARLKTKGKIVDDFDLLIGATAISNNLILATRNVKDFERMAAITIEDWTI